MRFQMHSSGHLEDTISDDSKFLFVSKSTNSSWLSLIWKMICRCDFVLVSPQLRSITAIHSEALLLFWKSEIDEDLWSEYDVRLLDSKRYLHVELSLTLLLLETSCCRSYAYEAIRVAITLSRRSRDMFWKRLTTWRATVSPLWRTQRMRRWRSTEETRNDDPDEDLKMTVTRTVVTQGRTRSRVLGDVSVQCPSQNSCARSPWQVTRDGLECQTNHRDTASETLFSWHSYCWRSELKMLSTSKSFFEDLR